MSEANIKYLRAMKNQEGDNGEFRLCEIADVLGLSRPGVSKAASRLIEEGLIIKTDNGRYRISAKGKELLRFYEVCIEKIANILKDGFGLKDNAVKREAVVIAGDLSEDTLKKIYES